MAMVKKIIQFTKTYQKITTIISLLILIGVYLGICAVNILRSPIWFDEAFSSYIIRFNFADIWAYTGIDVHPPLYYWVLQCWTDLFGNSVFAMRSLSVIFGVVGLVLTYAIMRKLTDSRKKGLIAAALVALSPFWVRYGIEARMYTMEISLLLGATLTLLYVKKNPKLWILYAGLILLAEWMQYFAALVILAQLVWWIIDNRDKKIKTWAKNCRGIFAAISGAVILSIPLIPSVLFMLHDVSSHGFWIPATTVVTPLNWLTNVLFYLNADQTSRYLTILLIVFVGLLLFKLIPKYKQPKLPICLIGIPTAVLMIINSFNERYVIISALALTMLVVCLLDKTRSSKVLVALLFICSLMGQYNIYQTGNTHIYHTSNPDTRQDYSKAIDYIRESVNEPITLISNDEFAYYNGAAYETKDVEVKIMPTAVLNEYSSVKMIYDNISNRFDRNNYLGKTVYFVTWEENDENVPNGFKILDRVKLADYTVLYTLRVE